MSQTNKEDKKKQEMERKMKEKENIKEQRKQNQNEVDEEDMHLDHLFVIDSTEWSTPQNEPVIPKTKSSSATRRQKVAYLETELRRSERIIKKTTSPILAITKEMANSKIKEESEILHEPNNIWPEEQEKEEEKFRNVDNVSRNQKNKVPEKENKDKGEITVVHGSEIQK